LNLSFNFVLSFHSIAKQFMRRSAISVYFYLLGFVFSSWASRIPDVKDKFSFSEAELGGMLFMLPLGALAALPLSGWLVHRGGSRLISALSLICYGLFLALVGLSDKPGLLSLALFLFGLIGNIGNISMNAQGLAIQHWMGKVILSSLHAMWGLGAFSAAAVSGWMMDLHFSISLHFALIGGIAFFGAVLFYFFLLPDVVAAETSEKVFAWPGKGLMLLGLICFCVTMSEGAMADWSSLYYRQVVNSLHTASTLGYTAFALCMTMGRFAGDRVLQWLSHAQLLRINGVLIFIGIFLALAFPVKWVVICGFALVGFGVSSVFPIVYMLAAKSKTMSTSAALAAVSSVGFIGFLIGPPMIGFVAEETGLRMSLWVVALLGLIIMMLAYRLESSVE
jgi:MFS family permease